MTAHVGESRDKNNVNYDSINVNEDWMVFKSGHQLVPLYVVHFDTRQNRRHQIQKWPTGIPLIVPPSPWGTSTAVPASIHPISRVGGPTSILPGFSFSGYPATVATAHPFGKATATPTPWGPSVVGGGVYGAHGLNGIAGGSGGGFAFTYSPPFIQAEVLRIHHVTIQPQYATKSVDELRYENMMMSKYSMSSTFRK